MSFIAILQEMVEGVDGGIGAALMGSDGIAIAEWMSPGARERSSLEEVASAGVEFGRVLDEIRKVADVLGGGALKETVISLARLIFIFRGVADDAFLVMALVPEANLGRARYLVRCSLSALQEEL